MPAVTTSDRARAHGLSPEVRWYCESRGYEVPEWTKPLWRTPEPGEEQGARFDPARVDRVIAALRALLQVLDAEECPSRKECMIK